MTNVCFPRYPWTRRASYKSSPYLRSRLASYGHRWDCNSHAGADEICQARALSNIPRSSESRQCSWPSAYHVCDTAACRIRGQKSPTVERFRSHSFAKTFLTELSFIAASPWHPTYKREILRNLSGGVKGLHAEQPRKFVLAGVPCYEERAISAQALVHTNAVLSFVTRLR